MATGDRTLSATIDLVAATPADRPVIERLVQFYCYDWSEIVGNPVDADGRYRAVDTEVIWRPEYRVFVVKVDGHLAGFAFVASHDSYLGDGETMLIDEFFIMRAYRRRGVGEHVARALFDRFPGRWEVSEVPANTGAQAFWRRIIGRYTAGRYREVWVDSPRWRGPVQSFVSGAAAT